MEILLYLKMAHANQRLTAKESRLCQPQEQTAFVFCEGTVLHSPPLLNEGYIRSSLECRAMNGHVTVSGYKKNLYKKFNKCLIYILIYNAPDLIYDVR